MNNLINHVDNTIYTGCQVSFNDDKTDDFDIFIVESITGEQVFLKGFTRAFHLDELIKVHNN